MIRFWGDVLIGCVVLAAVGAIGFALLSATPMAVGVILGFSGILGILIFGCIFVPPLILIIFGFSRKRPGLALSPFLAAGIPAGFLILSGYQQMLEVRGLEQRAFLKPEAEHDLLVLPLGRCNTYCMQVLTETRYAVAIGASSTDPDTLYRKASGADCYRAENVEMLVAFTQAGYAGLCATASPIAAVNDALIVEWQTARTEHPRVSLPSGYRGFLYSFIERRQGKDRLLGRWAGGTVHALMTLPIGERFTDLDFYEAALGFRFSNEQVVGPDSLRARIDKLTPLLLLPDVQPMAIGAYGDLLYQFRKEEPAAAEPLLAVMVASANPKVRAVGLADRFQRRTPAPPSPPDAYDRSIAPRP